MRDPEKDSKASAPVAKPEPTKPVPAKQSDPYLRAPNEDDDGYDPYSDRRYEPPMFERDPWY